MDKKKIILDVDTGSDDAIAIMTAVLSDELDVLGITTVNGNRPVMNTTENTLRVLDLLKSDIPVYRGCEEPMVAGLMPERQLFRKTNDKKELGGKTVTYHYEFLEELPPSVSKAQDISAVQYLIKALNDSDGDITIIAVGPLTNLGVAMRADPGIINKIKKLIIMGGGCRQTNTTSAAEFNIWKDPEAAQIVLTSGCEILLVPLDATHRAYVGSEESMKLRQIGTPVGIATADLLDARIQAYDLMQPIECAPYGSTPPHDALAVCAAIDETVLRDVRLCRVDVDCGGSWADGMTIVDPRVLTDQPENVHVAFNADREKFVSMLFDILGKKNQEDR
ncbi:MAG: nucleoside hydrolase [Enterocloster bolteae]|uniref:nucleoside hydrolase n=1 Tax=Enterocloster bolteae TaxID=208479 RepID=UPI003994018C